ncbi:MAG: hypothetical protein OEZ39_03665 [Gammaproteobacteria bacterium]|nr:hypothetical protein [Gammaproteobacteria bacterium]
MDKYIKIFVLLGCIALPGVSHAANVVSGTSLAIKDIFFHATVQTLPGNSGYGGMTQVRFANINWNNSTTCSIYDVFIKKEDTHMISAVLAAHATGKPIRLYVDDSAEGQGVNNICYLRAVGLTQ